MARLESTATAGYFPTPPRVVSWLSRWVVSDDKPGKRAIRLLDPCAGTGAAAATMGRALKAETFGIELNKDRADAACEALLRVLGEVSTLGEVRLGHGAFSLLYLNPPYDYDDEKKRLEHAFLTRCTDVLMPGGVLVFLIPQHRLGVSARYLAAHYEQRRVYRFPDPEYAAFKQIVVLARRRMRAAADPEAQAVLERYSDPRTELPGLPEQPRDPYVVPSLPANPAPIFAPLYFDAAVAALEAQQKGVFSRSDFIDQVWPEDPPPIRPLMPLLRGHRALLLAAGLVNNRVLKRDSQRILVKGRVGKIMVRDDQESDETKDVQREVLNTSLLMLDLQTGAFEKIESGLEAAT